MNVDIIEKPKKNISEDIKVGSSTDIVNPYAFSLSSVYPLSIRSCLSHLT